ncbi:hypothetical protein Tco_0768978 [Tanacetum coccineum]|uniref:Uncharacterized protein n=1 Tax=Tanacetum coccineum TaxID=301880 RepID=A0ABQ4Z907_9ASTR
MNDSCINQLGLVQSLPLKHISYHLRDLTWDLLFQPMFDESLNPPTYVDLQAPEVIAPIPEAVAPEHAVSTGSPSSTIVDQDAPSPKDNHDIEVAHMGNDPYLRYSIPEVPSDQSSSSVVIHTIVPTNHQSQRHLHKPIEYAIESLKEIWLMNLVTSGYSHGGEVNWLRIKKGKCRSITQLLYDWHPPLAYSQYRPDLQIAICMCARLIRSAYQKHLNAVKGYLRFSKKGNVHGWSVGIEGFFLCTNSFADGIMLVVQNTP